MSSSQAGTGSDAAGGADAWFTPGRFALLLGLLIAACFPHVITGLETFYYRDFAVFGYPLAVFHKDSFWRGEWPLWNPLSDCGIPFTAQWNTLTLYPLSLIYLLLPLPWSLDIFCLAHLFLAGMGMYFLAHRWTGNRLAAAVGGIAFAYNGLTWHSLMWPNDIAALGWMPWVVLALERAWREGGRRIILAGLVGAMQMLAGAPEVILFTWFIVGCFWLAECFAGKISPLRLMLRGATAGLLVTALSLVQLLPFLDLLAHSHRDNSYSDAQWAMPATGWANFLVPIFHSVRAARGVFMQHDQYWTSSYYAGVGVLALALFALWRARERRVWVLAALTLFGLVMALGNHGFVYGALRKIIPQLGFMRFPIKFVLPATFALPLLAAHGFARLRAMPPAEWPREWQRLRWLGATLLALIVVILLCAWQFPQPDDRPLATALNGLRGAIFLVAILGCIALLHRKAELKPHIIFSAVLLVVLWMDVFTHVPALSPTVTPSVLQPDAMRQYLREKKFLQSDTQLRLGESRIMQTLASLRKMYFGGQEDPVNDVYGRRAQFYDNLNILDHIPKLDGFYSLYLREFNTVITELYLSSNDLPHLKDFLGISHESRATNEMEWTERKTYSPLLTAGQQPFFLDDPAALKSLLDPAFDGTKMVFLPTNAITTVTATNRVEVQLTAPEFSANRLAVQTQSAAPAILVIAQAWYHPWHAYVDGRPVPLWRANYAFQALQVPAGSHHVQVVYEDNLFKAGGIVSLLSLLACGVVFLLIARCRSPLPSPAL